MQLSIRLPAAAAAVTVTALAGFAAALSEPEHGISRAFATALDERAAAHALAPMPAEGFDREHLHLSSLVSPRPDMSGQFLTGLSVGDRFTYVSSEGVAVVYKIMGMAALPIDPHSARNAAGQTRLLLVTATSGTAGGSKTTVRFIVEAAAAADTQARPVVRPLKPQAL